MAETVGFEPTDGFPSLVFKTSAINQTLPRFLSGEYGIRTREGFHLYLVSSEAPHHSDTLQCCDMQREQLFLAWAGGFEPPTHLRRYAFYQTELHPVTSFHWFVRIVGFEPTTSPIRMVHATKLRYILMAFNVCQTGNVTKHPV